MINVDGNTLWNNLSFNLKFLMTYCLINESKGWLSISSNAIDDVMLDWSLEWKYDDNNGSGCIFVMNRSI